MRVLMGQNVRASECPPIRAIRPDATLRIMSGSRPLFQTQMIDNYGKPIDRFAETASRVPGTDSPGRLPAASRCAETAGRQRLRYTHPLARTMPRRGGQGSACGRRILGRIPLTALFYGGFMDIDIADPTRRGQDLFTLSKGHAVAAMASIYADLGYFGREILRNSRSYASILNGHPGPVLPGVHIATGPDGPGLRRGAGLRDRWPHLAAVRFVLHVRRRRTAGGADLGSRDVRRLEEARQSVPDGGP